MNSIRAAMTAYGTTSLFVLLWSSGAIFAELGIRHAPAFAFLLMRFALACAALGLFGLWRGRWLPARGTRWRVALTGALLTGGYSICYLLALSRGLTPGLLATILGAQPILTMLATERRYSPRRLAGLAIALAGLALVVHPGGNAATASTGGALLGLASLACITVGAIFQKRIAQAPIDVLPLQNAIGLVMCAAIAPAMPLAFKPDATLVVSLLWLGLVISVVAQLLFYRLVQRGDLVNVTSLFYLVPIVTALMDYAFLGNRLRAGEIAGMAAILSGLALVLSADRQTRGIGRRVGVGE
ncbi:EamA family transporter [Trinickia dabaoshanensis]|uniref:EamA family transporter n=1 Tax=Trinickia dabaoshanensis TaxID=564714 RepID=A0A2N7W027_9BURK|nr:DMT family transporter [Trinickia dabaoshanensis]PMS22745.1 EamA family transporter [Trinickia dabaoshanensis]